MTAGERITKVEIVRAMQTLPDDAGIEQAMERLRFMQAVEDGFRQLDAGQSVSQEEVERRLARWLR